jgi:replicative DNA helicase
MRQGEIKMAETPTLGSVETEQGLCAAMLSVNEIIDPVADLVRAEDFTDDFYRAMFEIILREHSSGRTVNAFTLKPFFEATTYPLLAELGRISPMAIGARDFARQIADYGKRRRLIGGLTEVVADTSSPDVPLDKLVDAAELALTQALGKSHAVQTVSFAQAFDTTLKAIEDEAAGLGPQGIKIAGLEDFNELTGDLRRGELLYLGGRTSMGKTATALRIALGAAENGHGTLVLSLEMKASELTTRAMSELVFDYGESCPTFEQVRRGKLSEQHRRQIMEAREKIASWPLLISDPPSLNIGRIAMEIRRQRRKLALQGKTLDLVVIDYLGLIKGSPKLKRYEEVGEISRTLKEIAKECDVAMVILAQLNRQPESREDKRPMLSDLRDAGDIEQDADHVMFVYRDEYYLERSEPDKHDDSKAGKAKREDWEIAMGHARDRLELILAKARNGRVGKRICYFFGTHQAVRPSDYMSSRRGLM